MSSEEKAGALPALTVHITGEDRPWVVSIDAFNLACAVLDYGWSHGRVSRALRLPEAAVRAIVDARMKVDASTPLHSSAVH